MTAKTKKELQDQIKRLQLELKLARKRPVPTDEIDRIYYWLGRAIQNRRQEINLRQEDLSNGLSMTRTSTANIEAGRQRAPLHVWMKIAEALRITFTELIERAYALEMDELERN